MPDSPVLLAETPDGDLAGFVWGSIEGRSVHVIQIVIVPALRGLGLGEAIMKQFLTEMRARDMHRLSIELAGSSLRFSSFFQSIGFRPVSQILECSLDELAF